MNEANELQAKKRRLVKKKRQSRLKKRFVVFLFLFVCTGIIFTVLKAPFFNVKTIICVGQQELSEEQVIKIAGAKPNVNIFSTGVKQMKRRLLESPSIAECNVRRLFPNKLKIWVRESKPVAYVKNNGIFLIVDKNGQIIKLADGKTEELVRGIALLEGFRPASTKLGEKINSYEDNIHSKTFECINLLDKLGMLEQTTLISAVDLSDIRIDYQDRLYIMIGGYEQMEYKLTFVKKVISENLSEYEKAILDYRGKKLYVGPRVQEEEKPQEGQATTDVNEQENKNGSEEQKTENTEKPQAEDEIATAGNNSPAESGQADE